MNVATVLSQLTHLFLRSQKNCPSNTEKYMYTLPYAVYLGSSHL